MKPSSIRLLAALPVPDATWEPREPSTRPNHHPRGILRHVSGVHPIVVVGALDEPAAREAAGVSPTSVLAG